MIGMAYLNVLIGAMDVLVFMRCCEDWSDFNWRIVSRFKTGYIIG